jgi:hypothetical protein
MRAPGVPPKVFMALMFAGDMPRGDVEFDRAFEVEA